MTTSTTYLKEYGTDLSNRFCGSELRSRVVASAETGIPQIIDFEGVRTLSESFADELFAVIVEELGSDWFRQHLRLVNLTPEIRRTILQTVLDREKHTSP